MKLVSLNVSLPKEIQFRGKTIRTGIYKEPVEGRRRVSTLNIDGDGQADLSVHGGPNKAVYAYPFEHYEFWRGQLPGMKLSWGNFGENFTTEGLLEDQVTIGDRFRVGTVEVKVTEPRMPCYKLGLRFGRADMVKRFLASRRPGFYFSVLTEGEVEAGDTFELVQRDPDAIRVTDITRLYVVDRDDLDTMRRVIHSDAVPESWRGYFLHQLEKRGAKA